MYISRVFEIICQIDYFCNNSRRNVGVVQLCENNCERKYDFNVIFTALYFLRAPSAYEYLK